MRFIVANDTDGPVKIAHRFSRSNSTCHSPDFMAGESAIAARKYFPFVCSAAEIDYIELSQDGRSCRVDRADLMGMSGELKASACFGNGRFSKRRAAL